MGQYYTPVLRNGNKYRRVYSHDFGSGLKLMEHSYVGNYFVNVIANAILEDPTNLCWVGDYANDDLELMQNPKFQKVYDYSMREDIIYTTLENPNSEFNWEKDWYFVNETKKEYLLMPKAGNFVISPIPLLTAIGNGRGGGDYFGINMSMIGYWACDKVFLTDKKPNESNYANITTDAVFEEHKDEN